MAVVVSIVESDYRVRESFSQWINLAGGFHCVSHYGLPLEAISKLPCHKPDIVLIGLKLSGLSGLECLLRLKRRLPATQFLILIDDEDVEQIYQALTAGAIGCLSKRMLPRELTTSLKDIHKGGSVIPGEVVRKILLSLHSKVDVWNSRVFSPRERQVSELLLAGYSYKRIARAFDIEVTTAATHVRRIYKKLDVHSRAEAAARLSGLESQLQLTGGNSFGPFSARSCKREQLLREPVRRAKA